MVGGNIPKLISRVLEMSYRESLIYIQQHCGYPTIQEVKERNLRELEKITNLTKPSDFVTYDIRRFRFGSSWWINFGGFDRKTVGSFSLGYDSVSRRAIIPIAFDGKWISVIRRASNEKQTPRYLYEQNFDRGRILYPWDKVPRRNSSCILVEGPRDAIRLHSYGFRGTLACLGSGITASQTKLIVDNFDEVLVWLDNDMSGQLNTLYTCEKLSGLIPRVYVVPYLNNKYNDPNECTLSYATKCLKAKTHWSHLL